MARVPSSAIHSRSIRASTWKRAAALGQLLLGEQARLDPLGQLDLLLGVEQRHLADLLQVVLDRVRGGTRHRDLRGRKIVVVVAEDEDLLLFAAVRRDLDDPGARRAGAIGLGVRLRGRPVGLGPVGLVGCVRCFRTVNLVRDQVGDLGDTSDVVGHVQVLGERDLEVHLSGVEIVEIQIRVGIQIGLVKIHRGQAAVGVGAQLGTVLVRVMGSRTSWPRSRLNRLILDGPGPLVRRPGALPRCGVSSAHDHGHPFLRWVDATRD